MATNSNMKKLRRLPLTSLPADTNNKRRPPSKVNGSSSLKASSSNLTSSTRLLSDSYFQQVMDPEVSVDENIRKNVRCVNPMSKTMILSSNSADNSDEAEVREQCISVWEDVDTVRRACSWGEEDGEIDCDYVYSENKFTSIDSEGTAFSKPSNDCPYIFEPLPLSKKVASDEVMQFTFNGAYTVINGDCGVFTRKRAC